MAFTSKKKFILISLFTIISLVTILFFSFFTQSSLSNYFLSDFYKTTRDCESQAFIKNLLLCTQSTIEGYSFSLNKNREINSDLTQLGIDINKNPKNYLTDSPSYQPISKDIDRIKILLVPEEQKHFITQYSVDGPQAMSVGIVEEDDWLIIKIYIAHNQIPASDIELATNNYIFYSLFAITNNWPPTYDAIKTVNSHLNKIYDGKTEGLPFLVTRK